MLRDLRYLLSMSNVTEETRKLFEESWPKKCSCGKTLSEDDWEKCHYVGLQKVPPEYGLPDMELRNCPSCDSTMAVAVPNDFV